MVTDGILGAVQMIIDRFKTSDEIYAGKIIWDMLSDYDEDEWYSMSDEQKKEWIIKYIEHRQKTEINVAFQGLEVVKMKQFTADFHVFGSYGTQICTADTIEELIKTLIDRGYNLHKNEEKRIVDWSKTTDKKYYGMNITIRRGELEMTEYTSF